MSWLAAYKKSATQEEDLREAKRQKLLSERLARQKARENRIKDLETAIKAQREADEAYQEFVHELLNLDPNIFEDEIGDENNSEISIDSDPDIMEDFDNLSANNGPDAIKNLGQIKVNWDAEDPVYFFPKLETELQIFEVNKQYTKRQALIRLLPDDVGKEFKHLINLQESQAGDKPYKTLKDALIKAYGPKPGDAFQRAMSRVMVGKPSVLLKLLISDICKQNLSNNCCCPNTVWGLFQNQIPMYLKNGLANEEFSAATMHQIMDKADNYWAANQDKQVAAVSSPVTTTATPSTTPSAPSAEVASVTRGRGGFRGQRGGRGFRGGRGGNRGGNNQSQGPDPRGKRHESNPPWNSCAAHWVFYDKAWKCQAPTTCPLKDKVTPKNQA